MKLLNILSDLQKEKIKSLVSERSKDGAIDCDTASRIAGELGLPSRAVGEACNQMGIKIKNCRLGCFK